MDRAHRHLCGDAQYKHGMEEPLLDRAWVFQERMLSRRTVYVSSSEVLWECSAGYLCECGQINSAIPAGFNGLKWEFGDCGPFIGRYCAPLSKKVGFSDVCLSKESPKQALAFWRSMMQEYTRLLLTRESDRDIALSAIMKSSMTGKDLAYYAGVWIQDLPQPLLWTIGGRVSRPITPEKGMDAPSWSWLWRKGNGGQEVFLNKIEWDYYDEESFEKDAWVSFHVPDETYQRYHNRPLIAPTLGYFPLHLTAPFLYGLVHPQPPSDARYSATPLMSFPDNGPLTDRIKAYGQNFMIRVKFDDAYHRNPLRCKGYCVLLGQASRTPGNWNYGDSKECMLFVEEIPSPEHERRYVRTGVVRFGPQSFSFRAASGQVDEDCTVIEKTNLFDDAQVKEFIIV